MDIDESSPLGLFYRFFFKKFHKITVILFHSYFEIEFLFKNILLKFGKQTMFLIYASKENVFQSNHFITI